MLYALAIFAMLAILSVLIIVHECGHFSVARFFGFQTPVFGFGLPFGPHWVIGRKWGTEFRVHACLMGGYVAIPELGDESQVSEEAFGVPLAPFRKFPIWQRALVAVAGVGFNVIFAYLVMLTSFFVVGEPINAVVVQGLPTKDNPIATNAGVKVNDQIVAVNDDSVNTSSTDTIRLLQAQKLKLLHLHVLRDNKPLVLDMTPNANGKVGMALTESTIGFRPAQGSVFEIFGKAFKMLCNITWTMIDQLRLMVEGLMAGPKGGAGGHAKVGLQDLHGVLAVIKIGADIAGQDWTKLFMFTILISMDLAIINLLPWPALDGGHLAFMLFEVVRGKPMDERAQGEIVKWGFLSLIALMVVIMVNDVTALVTGKLDLKKDKESQQETKAPGDNKGDAVKKDVEPAAEPAVEHPKEP